MRDVYDREIERCARMSAYELDVAWTLSAWHSPLFDICDAERTREGRCGCLTQVREGSPAQTPELTTAIRRDLSIPSSIVALHRGWDDLSIDERRARLEPFARWQRRLDAEIPRREPPQEPARMTPDERDIMDRWDVRQAADAGDDEPDLDEREARREADAEREWEARRNGDYDA